MSKAIEGSTESRPTKSTQRWVAVYRGWPICFENDPFRQMFRLVKASEATTFPTPEAALAKVRTHEIYQPHVTIEPLNL